MSRSASAAASSSLFFDGGLEKSIEPKNEIAVKMSTRFEQPRGSREVFKMFPEVKVRVDQATAPQSQVQ